MRCLIDWAAAAATSLHPPVHAAFVGRCQLRWRRRRRILAEKCSERIRTKCRQMHKNAKRRETPKRKRRQRRQRRQCYRSEVKVNAGSGVCCRRLRRLPMPKSTAARQRQLGLSVALQSFVESVAFCGFRSLNSRSCARALKALTYSSCVCYVCRYYYCYLLIIQIMCNKQIKPNCGRYT